MQTLDENYQIYYNNSVIYCVLENKNKAEALLISQLSVLTDTIAITNVAGLLLNIDKRPTMPPSLIDWIEYHIIAFLASSSNLCYIATYSDNPPKDTSLIKIGTLLENYGFLHRHFNRLELACDWINEKFAQKICQEA